MWPCVLPEDGFVARFQADIDPVDGHGQVEDGFENGRCISVAHGRLDEFGFSDFFGQGEQMSAGFFDTDFRDADLRRGFNHGQGEGIEQHFGQSWVSVASTFSWVLA